MKMDTQIAVNGIMSRITFKCQNAKESYMALGTIGGPWGNDV